MKELHVKRFCGTFEAPMIPANACCDFVNDNPQIEVQTIVHSNNDVFLYYRGKEISEFHYNKEMLEKEITPFNFKGK